MHIRINRFSNASGQIRQCCQIEMAIKESGYFNLGFRLEIVPHGIKEKSTLKNKKTDLVLTSAQNKFNWLPLLTGCSMVHVVHFQIRELCSMRITYIINLMVNECAICQTAKSKLLTGSKVYN